MSVFIKLIQSV